MNTQQIQQDIFNFKKQHGFNTTDPIKEMFHLMEEVGELTKAIRKAQNFHLDMDKMSDEDELNQNVSEEIADVLIFLFNIATIHNIDIEKAFVDKWEINQSRTWIQPLDIVKTQNVNTL